MNREYDTAEVAASGDASDAPAPGDPVGRVNLPEEPEPDPMQDVAVAGDMGDSYGATGQDGQLREKVVYGLMAGVLMILAMVVILKGVFEQKMPI
jgi:hypothetical protein